MKRLIISVDVGIKNLAICMLSAVPGGSPLKKTDCEILYWKWMDIQSSQMMHPQKKEKSKKKTSQILKCETIVKKSGKVCNRNGLPNMKGKIVCGIHDSKRKKIPNPQQVCHAMHQSMSVVLDEIGEKLECLKEPHDIRVVIEQQSLNSKILLLCSHVIFSKFIEYFDNGVPVKFAPAYNKLLVYDGPPIQCTLKSAYAHRKHLSKKQTEYFLDKQGATENFKTFYKNCKSKQDDISDAFLQGLYEAFGAANKTIKTDTSNAKKRRRKKF